MNRFSHNSRAAIKARAIASRLKYAVLLAAAVALISASVFVVQDGTLAWFTDSAQSVNRFSIARVSIQALSQPGGGVAVKNTGTIPVYVRARATVNIKDAEGAIVSPTAPEQYSISSAGWTLSGNYYYYSSALAVGAETPPIAASAISVPDGCSLSLELIPEALQTAPASVVDAAWPGHPQFD